MNTQTEMKKIIQIRFEKSWMEKNDFDIYYYEHV